MTLLEPIARDMASVDALAPQMIPVGIDLLSCAQRTRAAQAKATKKPPKADAKPSAED